MDKININYDNEKSINDGEKQKAKLENRGFKLIKTIQTGYNKFCLIYEV